MEKELNIAAILKDKPVGTKLWTDMFGEVTLYVVTEACNRFQVKHHNKEPWFEKDGRLYEEGSLCIYPSRNMRDWSKFAWKKGDVLVSNNTLVVFNRFVNDDYTDFEAAFEGYQNETYDEGNIFFTDDFSKATDDGAKDFIKNIEGHYGGKLNLETLEIEKSQFKDGDIVVLNKSASFRKEIRIFKEITNKQINFGKYYISFEVDNNNKLMNPTINFQASCRSIHLATEEEKRQLFAALEKEGKRWNPDTKTLEDLPKKCEFKPMDWCLMRIKGDCWKLCQFGFKGEGKEDPGFNAVGGSWFDECIPYNDQTAHLLGTTDDWKGGDG